MESPRYRSGAVARLVGMPVTTLRVWERRYGLGGESPSLGAHRLYDGAGVERIALLRRLTQEGHAIGAIAGLEMQALRAVGAAPSVAADAGAAAADAPPRLVVVGTALGMRLRQSAGARWQVLAVHEDLASAARAASREPADWLLVGWAVLPDAAPSALQGARSACRAARVGAVYGYGSAQARRALATAGVEGLRDGPDDAALAAWLARPGPARRPGRAPRPAPAPVAGLPPPRFDEQALAELASRGTAVACECPRHVAELLVQLSRFEQYSARCAHRSRADAELHARLQRAAGDARLLMERALDAVIEHEGWPQPLSAAAR